MNVEVKFKEDLTEVLGSRMKESDDFCKKVYSALTNVKWFRIDHEREDDLGFSFRAAGRYISEVIGKGDYLDWYCCAPSSQVDNEISKLMKKAGYKFRLLGD